MTNDIIFSFFFLGIKKESKEKSYSIKTYLNEATLCSATARENVLIFGTKCGHLLGFSLPTVNYVGNIQLGFTPMRITLNNNST